MDHVIRRRRLHNIIAELRSIADIEWQRSAWSREDSTLVNSYRETIAQIYGSLDAEDLFSANLDDLGINESRRLGILEALRELGSYYDAHELDIPSENLLADPRWVAIAQRVGESIGDL